MRKWKHGALPIWLDDPRLLQLLEEMWPPRDWCQQWEDAGIVEKKRLQYINIYTYIRLINLINKIHPSTQIYCTLHTTDMNITELMIYNLEHFITIYIYIYYIYICI